MRLLAGLAIACSVTGLIGAAATAACAQSAPSTVDPDTAALLMSAAFQRDAANDQNFEAPAAQADPLAGLLDRDDYAARDNVTRWGVKEVVLGASDDGSVVDSIRLRVGETLPTKTPHPLDLARLGETQDKAYDVTLTRDWPRAVSYEGDRYDVAFSPHAGLGVGSRGGSAEAGATLTLGRRSAAQSVSNRLRAMGFRDSSGDKGGRWYLFAAASGRAVGLSLASRDPASGWNRTQESSSALIGDAQVGVGWRKGAVQTSLGYIHRSVKGDHMVWGENAQDDSMVAFSLSIRPRR